MTPEVCGDNRFEIIEKAKQAIIESTNIETSPEEMAVLDNILFRCWQMGWIDKYGNQPSTDGDTISRQDAVKEIDSFCGEVWTESEADFARGLGAALSIVESLPSVQPSGDLISRESALAEFRDGRDVYDIMESIEELPSAETPTVLEKHQLSEETPTNTPTDLISRDDAIALVIKAIHGTDNEEIKEYLFDGLRKQMWSLPSAEPKTAYWIPNLIDLGFGKPVVDSYSCSECKEECNLNYDYCPNCGADMKGGDDE